MIVYNKLLLLLSTILLILHYNVIIIVNAQQSTNNIIHGHIIPHSHCDTGWLDTFEQYYMRDVRSILDNVVSSLHSDEKKRFVWAETSFFARWYEMKTGEEKQRFRKLVMNGQWEFVGGGWSQNDEALPDITGWINQHTVGHQYLLQNFGVQPRVAWQIDPFGHSSVTPSLASLMGYDALVINRIHFAMKAQFITQKHMEFMWRGADIGGDSSTHMFTHVLHTHYSAPPGFDWEEGAMAVNAGNVHFRCTELCNIIKSRANAYRSKHLLIPFGDDFKFKNAAYQFGQMDQIIRHMNSKSHEYGCSLQYSTAHEYFKHVATESNVKYPVYGGDFFPYADNADSYWTGYFVTRPVMKAMHRRHATILRSAEIMHALVRSNPAPASNPNPSPVNRQFWENQFQDILTARRDAALFLHHDAITGTSRGQVVSDYMDRMVGSSRKLLILTQDLLQHTLTKHPNPSPKLTSTAYILKSSTTKIYPLVIHNNLAWKRKEVISVRVETPYAYVTDGKGDPVQAQIDPFWDDFSSEAPVSGTYVLHFVSNVDALGAHTYFVQVLSASISASSPLYKATKMSTTIVYVSKSSLTGGLFRGNIGKSKDNIERRELKDEAPYVQNDLLRVELSTKTGLITSITDRKRGINIPASQIYAEYTTDRSGAYIFRPNQGARDIRRTRHIVLRLSHGVVTNTYAMRFNEYDLLATLPNGDDYELCGHLYLTQSVVARANQELIVKFQSKLNNGNLFHTNNGLEWRQRTHQEFPVAANYYPAVYGCRIEDQGNHHRLMIGTTHSLGCASQTNGELELMLHRSMNQDDGRGLAQAVVDGSRVDVPLIIGIDQISLNDESEHDEDFYRRILRVNNPMTVFYGSQGSEIQSVQSWNKLHLTHYSPLNSKNSLPNDVHMLTLAVRDAVSDDIVLQLQSFGKKTRWTKPISSLFCPEMGFKARHLRAVTASINQDVPLEQYTLQRAVYHGENYESNSIGGVNKILSSVTNELAKQNTAEAGVFISKSALERSKQAAAAAEGNTKSTTATTMNNNNNMNQKPPVMNKVGRGLFPKLWGGGRRLLADDAEPIKLIDDDDDVDNDNNEEKHAKVDDGDGDDDVIDLSDDDEGDGGGGKKKMTQNPTQKPKPKLKPTAKPKPTATPKPTIKVTPKPTKKKIIATARPPRIPPKASSKPKPTKPKPTEPKPTKDKKKSNNKGKQRSKPSTLSESDIFDLDSKLPGSISVRPRQLRSYVFNLKSSESPVNTAIVPVAQKMEEQPTATVAKPMWGKQLFNSLFSADVNNNQVSSTTSNTGMTNSNTMSNSISNSYQSNTVGTTTTSSTIDIESGLVPIYNDEYQVWLPSSRQQYVVVILTMITVYFYAWRLRLARSCLCFSSSSD